MKTFKQFELLINVLLILSFTIYSFIFQTMDTLFLSYFLIGAVQVAGMLIHAGKSWFTANRSIRWFYHWIVLVLLLLFPTGFSFYFLLYTAPVFAVFYTYLCWRELQTVKLKELVHLK
jgi:hypothetical protein